ncbi:hypothetical protein RPC_4172 [Rhodopseudomonas palustris BisB18]|uniref:Uncharacterized protein n=1 Tax=Rhodopseudomonas palustris (strain BisB18) TaxID=316056 RepID=Q20YT9_RHOPB
MRVGHGEWVMASETPAFGRPVWTKTDIKRAPDAAHRAALYGVVRCRAGAVTERGPRSGPGSAEQHFVLHRARDTMPNSFSSSLLRIPFGKSEQARDGTIELDHRSARSL